MPAKHEEESNVAAAPSDSVAVDTTADRSPGSRKSRPQDRMEVLQASLLDRIEEGRKKIQKHPSSMNALSSLKASKLKNADSIITLNLGQPGVVRADSRGATSIPKGGLYQRSFPHLPGHFHLKSSSAKE